VTAAERALLAFVDNNACSIRQALLSMAEKNEHDAAELDGQDDPNFRNVARVLRESGQAWRTMATKFDTMVNDLPVAAY
jgi:hypothetical protein